MQDDECFDDGTTSFVCRGDDRAVFDRWVGFEGGFYFDGSWLRS